jgi:diadenosine tetraphosphate (Ap4A) HIT family hydrolase
MTLPYAEPLTRLEPQPRVIPEPIREGDVGGEPCGLCRWLNGESDRTEEPLWSDDHWALCRASDVTIPGVVWLASKRHFDSFADMPDAEAATYARTVGRIERAILGLGEIARVHVYRWGDGSAHFHVWFFPRPLGMLEARREMLPLWADLLPAAPEEAVVDAEQRIRKALEAGE